MEAYWWRISDVILQRLLINNACNFPVDERSSSVVSLFLTFLFLFFSKINIELYRIHIKEKAMSYCISFYM